MEAALAAADKTVSSLLSWGASPDKTDFEDHTALIFAIGSTCLTTINLLAPVTQVNLGRALYFLARDKVELMTGELKQLVERAAQDREAAIKGLETAASFGSIKMINMIAEQTKDHSIFEENKKEIWIEAVRSDRKATVSAILHLLPNPPLRGNHPGIGAKGARGGWAAIEPGAGYGTCGAGGVDGREGRCAEVP